MSNAAVEGTHYTRRLQFIPTCIARRNQRLYSMKCVSDSIFRSLMNVTATYTLGNYTVIGKQRALSLDSWPISTLGSAIGYSCVLTTVVAREYSVLSTRFNTCPPYVKVDSKITSDFKAVYL